MINIEENLNYLGLKVKDRITGFTGVVTTVSFDLYGCVQVIINPGIDKDGKIQESAWFDISRLGIIDEDPVIEIPTFDYSKGPEPKSIPKH
jgi:hypothetical protein